MNTKEELILLRMIADAADRMLRSYDDSVEAMRVETDKEWQRAMDRRTTATNELKELLKKRRWESRQYLMFPDDTKDVVRHEGWMNIRYCTDGRHVTSYYIYQNKEMAEKIRLDEYRTVRVNWEDEQ